jgi:hypothetical protein
VHAAHLLPLAADELRQAAVRALEELPAGRATVFFDDTQVVDIAREKSCDGGADIAATASGAVVANKSSPPCAPAAGANPLADLLGYR